MLQTALGKKTITLTLKNRLPAPSPLSPPVVTARYNEPDCEKTVGCFLLPDEDQLLSMILFEQEKRHENFNR
ncbi:MAG: hypothetical protein ACOYMW_13430 [Candidatus Competibacteraceae bacterium]|jgi:hypothetical protein